MTETPGEPTPVPILLVDDRPSNLISLEAVLDRPDYALVLARSGTDALAQVLRQEFAVILLDIAMPGMDGFETASLIKEREQSKRVPIIFITASVYEMEQIFRAYTVGAVDFLRKPTDAHQVRAKVEVFVELYRQRKEIERQAARIREIERATHVAELEEAVRVRDDFLTIAAHELKTPITPLRLRTASLLRHLERSGGAAPLAARMKSGLLAIDASAERLEELVDRVLDLTRLQSGEMELVPEEVDLAALTAEVIRRSTVGDGSDQPAITLKAPDPVRGRWDRVRIEQVVTNLLSNARKYGDGKTIEVEVSGSGETARLTVRDHGIGIDEQALPRLFRRFERVAPVRHYGGLGLGLWIARQIVDSHGGRISVWSKPGAGCLFTVELPRWAAAARPPRPIAMGS